MRDIVFKAITIQGHKQRHLSFKESVEEGGISVKIEKTWGYAIKSITPLCQIIDLREWMIAQHGSENSSSLKDLSIYRNDNTKTGEDKFEYNLIGDLFVINQNKIFIIEFSYFFSINSMILSMKE